MHIEKQEVLTETSGFGNIFCEPPLVAVHCKQKNIALPSDSVATEDYFSATDATQQTPAVSDRLDGVSADGCRDWRLFCWRKAADETHRSDVNARARARLAWERCVPRWDPVMLSQQHKFSSGVNSVCTLSPVDTGIWSVPAGCARLTLKHEKWGNHHWKSTSSTDTRTPKLKDRMACLK